MSIVELFLISIGLSLDAFAVSIAAGVRMKRFRMDHAVRMALLFGGFQAFMPILGWYAGGRIESFAARYDHWIAFMLLTAIGVKMVYEAVKLEEKEKIDFQHLFTLFILAVATSLDALAVGFSLSFLRVAIVGPAVVIGIITFLFSLCGVAIGNKVGHFFEKKIGILGGLILIGIGLKILLEHLK